MLLLLMVTSKGMAGVPRASLVVIAATLTTFGMPEAGLLLILGVDHFLDMGRSATNVLGNSIATAVVAKWEKELGPPREEALAQSINRCIRYVNSSAFCRAVSIKFAAAA
jgi:Na+/H+-dicarboxylate symporter